MIKIDYDGKSIELVYSSGLDFFKVDPEESLKIKVKATEHEKIKLENDNYLDKSRTAEEIVQIYLVKNAIEKEKGNCSLKKIILIRQDTICDITNNHLELEIILEGLAVFEKL